MVAEFFKITIQWIAIFIFFLLLVYAALQKPSEMQKHVIMLTIASILFISGYLIRIYAETMQAAMIGSTVTYMGQPFVMISAVMLIASFYGYRVPKWFFVFLCGLGGCVPLAVCTNPSHYLFYATAVFDTTAPYVPLITTHGPLYNVNLCFAFGCFVAYVVLILRGYRKVRSPIKRSLSLYSILMVVSGMLGYVVYFLKLTGGYDSTMLGMALGAVFLSVLFFRCRIFDIVDKAKDYALDISPDGLIVFDDSDSIIFKNAAAEKLMATLFPAEQIEALPSGESQLDLDKQHYAILVHTIASHGSYLGKSVEMHDISDSVNHQARLEEAVRRTTERLETVQRTIFGSMASIVEARSVETGDHIKRVSTYTEMIANSLRDIGLYRDILTDEYISTLVLSAPLHDIGKVSIPDAVLLKPGKLTAEEFEVIKTHALKGAEIIETTMNGLESEDYIAMASDIAKYHHERWDGTGYSCGLKGTEIPLSARIVALADCYDAMTSVRCYKDAFPDEKAMEIIRSESGTHFDPDIVEAFAICKKV